MEHANIGDIIELSNGLKLRLEFENDKNYFKTVDISNEEDVTTFYDIDHLKEFVIGESVWGYQAFLYEIVNIIYQNDNEFQEVKSEVLYIIDDALKTLERLGSDDKYCVPNGIIWTYNEVRHFLIKHIKM